ncbi:TPA: hypothetical protein ACJI4K_003401 [Clostridioides difficile]|uniref:hypothetical protein n=1 Tax=Clostridioides difficile TaxID=1496 RepID=UPI00038C6C73|nr:hypothetical protein [Clostridioides difficile]EQG38374.1 hypothetical protein QIO_0574 [Clostridioides difficile DA00129]MCL6820391.1 hypothetical protein [Clostridioides difficile]MDI6369705.1 hypothetical protein [Clostridioides difficile]MDL5147418.1 hypothetical protein [Clostridioides difficile]MDM9848071.1 hypothetical protein [Clostridioides difficile]
MKKIINSKYRALYLIIFFLIFNFGYSLYFGRNTEIGFYSNPSCVEEYILDIIVLIGIFFSVMLASFDITNNFINNFNKTTAEESIEINATISKELYKEIKDEIMKENSIKN